MGDENDGVALVAESTQYGPQLAHLRWREHCRWLVEDEHSGAAKEYFQDLDALRLSD